jgi:hypothetical protein
MTSMYAQVMVLTTNWSGLALATYFAIAAVAYELQIADRVHVWSGWPKSISQALANGLRVTHLSRQKVQ